MPQKDTVRLTQFSPGAGCGCKISSADLETILATQNPMSDFPNLLVGNQSKDDAAVFNIGNGESVISTTDFFTPIVDSPFDFGRIASVNAISDVYAMGGRPLMAIAILGWPVDKLPLDVAREVIEGARQVCLEAAIPLAGGHSIDVADPIFGLAVTGLVPTSNVKRNNGARPDSVLFLTKPIGIGIISTGEKAGKAHPDDTARIVKQMTTLNRIGETLAFRDEVNALTDVTGFGLLGHLIEVCEGSGVDAELDFDVIPLIENLQHYIDQKFFPGGLFRNYKGYRDRVEPLTDQQKYVLCDPQTSGGLLVSVDATHAEALAEEMEAAGEPFYRIGRLVPTENQAIRIKVR
jgi:selenide,water dikinase